jgi:hypothetical protein
MHLDSSGAGTYVSSITTKRSKQINRGRRWGGFTFVLDLVIDVVERE